MHWQCQFHVTPSNNGWSHKCMRCGWSRVFPEPILDLARDCIMAEPPPPCDCPAAGWCSRHSMKKSETLRRICQTNDSQRATWDYIAETGKSPHGQRPSLARAAVNLSLALIKHAADGGRLASDEAINRRLEICHTCPSRRFDGKICNHLNCGCSIQSKRFMSKLAWASESCPDGHWGTEP